jgi:hypothetical protein
MNINTYVVTVKIVTALPVDELVGQVKVFLDQSGIGTLTDDKATIPAPTSAVDHKRDRESGTAAAKRHNRC